MNRSIVWLAFVSFFLFALPVIVQSASSPLEKRLEELKSLEGDHPQVTLSLIAVGNSRIESWRTIYGDLDLAVLKRGFHGASISEFTRVADRYILEYLPVAVVVYDGDDEIRAGKAPEKVVADFRAFYEKMHSSPRQFPVVFLSLIPCPANREYWGAMRKTNDLLRALTEGRKNLYYFDITAPFLDQGGEVRPELFTGDGVTLNAEGYLILAALLKQKLADIGVNAAAQKDKKPIIPKQEE
jgi:hypothetical protein